MKKIISIFSLICILFVFSSCKTVVIEETKDDFSKYTREDYEGVKATEDGSKVEVEMNYARYNFIDELYNASDYIIVATPEETFDESKQLWYDKNKVATDDFSKVDMTYSYTERKMKVQKVYKGDDLKIKELTVCQHILINDDDMKLLFQNDYPLVKGEKYLLFLSKANAEEEKYFPAPQQGVYSLDSDKNTSNLEKEVKEKFKDEFKNK